MSARSPRGSGPPAPARLAAVLVFAAALAAAACGARNPQTPEELFERLRDAMSQGRTSDVYELTSEEFKQGWRRAIDNTRYTAGRNPGARGHTVSQFRVTFEELYALSPVEIFDRAHAGLEPLLRDARMIDRTTDPLDPADVWITFETTQGYRFRWIMREEPGRGWRLKSAEPVKVDTGEPSDR